MVCWEKGDRVLFIFDCLAFEYLEGEKKKIEKRRRSIRKGIRKIRKGVGKIKNGGGFWKLREKGEEMTKGEKGLRVIF